MSEKLKQILKDILVIVCIIVTISCIIISHLSLKYIDDNDPKELKDEIEKLNEEVLRYKIEKDSIIQVHNRTIEGLQSLKHKINVTYQQTAEDFSDIVIVCDDDILKYIASQIQD